MEVSAKELRTKPGKIIEQVAKGVEVIVTFRGKRLARIVPYDHEEIYPHDTTDELFGLWRNRRGMKVDDYIRRLRKKREL